MIQNNILNNTTSYKLQIILTHTGRVWNFQIHKITNSNIKLYQLRRWLFRKLGWNSTSKQKIGGPRKLGWINSTSKQEIGGSKNLCHLTIGLCAYSTNETLQYIVNKDKIYDKTIYLCFVNFLLHDQLV